MIKNLLQYWKIDVVCLQETKLEGDIGKMIKEVWGNRWSNYVQLQASGIRGGVVIIWDTREWEGVISSQGMYTITYSFTRKNQEFQWHLTGVYAPNDRQEREETWWEIGAARGLNSGPWVLCGDFNTT